MALVLLLCLASLLGLRHHSRFEAMRVLAFDATTWVFQVAAAPRDAWQEVSGFFATRAALRQENERLRQENLVLSGQLQQMADMTAENQRYRALLHSAEDIDETLLVAQVLAVTPDPDRHLLILDKGQRDGVAVGQPLLGAEGLMGQVVLAGASRSRALLITDAAHALPVQVSRNGVRGIAEGTGDLQRMVVRHIAATTDIVVGDLLVSSGLGGRFPPGYPVAEVVSIELLPGAAFATINARPLAALDRGRHVLIASGAAAPQKLD